MIMRAITLLACVGFCVAAWAALIAAAVQAAHAFGLVSGALQ